MRLSTKMVLIILLPAALIFMTALGFINIRYKRMALADAKDIADSYAREYANKIQAELNKDLGVARSLAQTFKSIQKNSAAPDVLYYKILRETLQNHPEYMAAFLQWELAYTNPGYLKSYGRRRITTYRDTTGIEQNNVLLNLQGDDTTGIYYHVKKEKKEYIVNPYYYTYDKAEALPSEVKITDKDVLETTLIIPIIDNDTFIGMTGMDIPVNRFQSLIDSIKPFPQSYAFLASNNGKWVAHVNRDLVNVRIADENPDDNEKYRYEEKIKKGKKVSFTSKYSKIGESAYVTFAPIFIGNSTTPWSLGIVFSIDVIMSQANSHLRFSIIVGAIGLLLLFISLLIISSGITHPIGLATDKLMALSRGAIHETRLLEVKSRDEIGIMTDSINTLIEGLNRIAVFATDIGSGNLDADYSLLSREDILGHTLIGMRNNLKKTNKELRKLSIVASRTDTAVVIMNAHGTIEWANKALEIIYGYSVEDVTGKHLKYFSGNPEIKDYLDRCIRTKSSVIYQTQATQKTGKKIWIQTTLTPILDENEISKIVAIDSDITELMNAEKAIRKQKSEIEEQRDKLQHLIAMKDKFFTIIAHDMKNPFASLLSITQSLSVSYDELSKEETRFYLKKVFSSAELLHGLLDNLLQWSTSQTGRMDYSPEIFDINKTVEENILLLKIFAERKSIELQSTIEEATPVYADKNMISTVIRNLINNAIKYTPEQGCVQIAIEKKEDMAILSVQDNGIGLTKEDQEKLFRIDVKTKSIGPENKETGTGIGLILCKEFVERNSGNIWVESSPGKGSSFRFSVKLSNDKKA